MDHSPLSGSKQHTKSGQEFTALILEIFRFNGRLLAAGDRLTKPLNLTSARWQVIGAIEEGPLSVAQIARNMGLARQSVQRLADHLEQEGIVHYLPNPDHKRAKLMGLTDRGRAVLSEIWKSQAKWANRIAGELSPDEIHAALSVVRRLRCRLDDDGSPAPRSSALS